MDDISANNQQDELETDVKKDRSLLYMGLGLGLVVLIMGYLTFFVEDVNKLFAEKETITAPVIEDRSAMKENAEMDDAEVRRSLIKFVEAFHYDQRRGYFDPPSYFAGITQTYYNYHNLTHKRLRDFHYKRLADMQNLKENWIVSSLNYERQGSDLVVTYWSQLDYLRPSLNVQESADVKNEMIINSEGKIISLREIEKKNFTSYAVMPEIDSTYMGEETGYTGPGSEVDLVSNPTETPNLKYEGKLYDLGTVETAPEYPGGQKELAKQLGSNLKYPVSACENKVEGKVYVSFIVEKAGNLTNLKVIKGIGSGCDEEALRVLNSCPSWKPGLVAGKPVRTSYTLPINFQLVD